MRLISLSTTCRRCSPAMASTRCRSSFPRGRSLRVSPEVPRSPRGTASCCAACSSRPRPTQSWWRKRSASGKRMTELRGVVSRATIPSESVKQNSSETPKSLVSYSPIHGSEQGGMNMKGLVVAISGILTIVYLGAIFEASQRTQSQRSWPIANEEEHTHAVSRSEGEAFKPGSKSPGVLLAQNKKLSDRLSALLRQQNPPVTDLQAASQGFRNLDQLVVAVHSSHNLGIPFNQLKTAAQTTRSLSKAIHLLKPDPD